MSSTKDDVLRMMAREELTLEDVKLIIRSARYQGEGDPRLHYANTLVPEASEYMRPYTLRALVRAEISEEVALAEIEREKLFFQRLVTLLQPLFRSFGKEARARNPFGIIMTIDDCHNDFHFTIKAARRDRQIREAKEKLTHAAKLANELVIALEGAKRHFDIEYHRYREAYSDAMEENPAFFLSDLVHELHVCGGVLHITNAIADFEPKHLFLFGNDDRTSIVEDAYRMCTMWDGPKLVTTPNSGFATFCSLLFEAVSGRSDEALAGAINRYARSAARKQWDREGENERERDEDNFQAEKAAMAASSREIERCKSLLGNPNLPEISIALLSIRMGYEQRRYEEANRKYGPHQVDLSQMNAVQREDFLVESVSHLKPKQRKKALKQLRDGTARAASDVEEGQARRAGQSTDS